MFAFSFQFDTTSSFRRITLWGHLLARRDDPASAYFIVAPNFWAEVLFRHSKRRETQNPNY